MVAGWLVNFTNGIAVTSQRTTWSSGTPVPDGRYQCLVVERRFDADRTAVVFQVEDGPHAGHCFQVDLTQASRAKKAASLDGNLPVVVHVVRRRSRAGRLYNSVTDFWQVRPWETMTVLGGMPAGDHGADALSPIFYNVDSQIESLHNDLYFVPEGHTPWAAPLMAEELADDLRRTLQASDALDTEHIDHPVARDADPTWFDRTLQRVAAEHIYGVLSVADGTQRLVHYEPAFTAYCRMKAPLDVAEIAAVSTFQFDDALLEHVRLGGGEIGEYRSPVWSRWIPVRFPGGDNAAEGLERCRLFVTALLRLEVPAALIMVFVAGGGDLEVMFPAACFGALPRPGFELVAGYLCMLIADWSVFCDENLAGPATGRVVLPEGDVTIDPTPYRPMAALAMPNTRTGGGDTFKVCITPAELLSTDPDGLARLAKHPRPFDPPPWDAVPQEMLASVWQFCVAVAVCRSQTVSQPTLANRWIHEKTFDFLRCGAASEELDAHLFAAALNLCDFRCPEPLMEALLGPVAFACGMTVTKFKRTLGNAIKKSRLARPMPIEAPPDAWFTRTKSIDE
jgi:hypothetical protein